MRKTVSLILLMALTVMLGASFVSCKEQRSAEALMREFCSAYGIFATVYTPEASEGDEGYVGRDFFSSLYGEGEECASDYAILLLSDLSRVAECALFICYTDYDAVLITDILHRRIEFIRSTAAVAGMEFPEDAFVYREGREVVMCALFSADEARKLWRAIL